MLLLNTCHDDCLADDTRDLASGSLPGQPLLPESGQSLPWDPGSQRAPQQLVSEALEHDSDFALPNLRADRRRPARSFQPQTQSELPEVPSIAFQDDVRSAPFVPPDARSPNRARATERTGLKETKQTLGQGTPKRAPAADTGYTARQLKV